mgnify:CR=1 FL=1
MTQTWIALLRGMNVGGHRITNADLTRAFAAMGCANVGTFRASGNVFFDGEGATADWTLRIQDGLRAALGYEVPTYLRTADELRAVAQVRPFSDAALAASKGKPQVTFWATEADEAVHAAVLDLATREDQLVIQGRELFWLPSGGFLESDLDLARIARLAGEGTTRTLGTVEGIVKKLGKR